MTKSLKFFFTLVVLGGIFISPVFASSGNTTPFEISIHTTIQDPDTKEFDIVANVNSSSMNDRVTISWNLPTGIDPINEKDVEENVDIAVGSNFYSIRVVPEGELESQITFTVESYSSITRALTHQRGLVKVSSDRIVMPIANEYIQLANYVQYRHTVLTAFWITLTVGITLYLAKLFVLEVFPEEPVSKIPRDSKIIEEFERRRIEESIPIKTSL